jgi:hypothetical protein
VQSANQVLIVAAVTERAPCRADAGVERRLRDDAALPDRVEQLVLTDDPVTIPNEENQQIEYLRLGMHNSAGASQLPPRDVDLEIGKTEVQAVCSFLELILNSTPNDDLSNSQWLSEWQAYTRRRCTCNTQADSRRKPRRKPVVPSVAKSARRGIAF